MKGVFTLPTITNTITDSVLVLNSEQVDYSICVIDIVNAAVEDNLMGVTYRVYILDRMQTNETYPLTIWSWSLDCVRMGISRLEKNFDDYSVGEVKFNSEQNNDIIAGCTLDITVRFPYVVDC